MLPHYWGPGGILRSFPMSVTIIPPQPKITPPQSSTAPAPPPWRRNAAATPGRLRLFFGAVCLSIFVLWLAAAGSIARTRQAIQTIGKDAVPSIVAAQQIRANMADMDASTANVFIGSGDNVLVKNQYDADRAKANDNLILAAQNITYGDAERGPILTLTNDLETYSGLVKAARTKGRPYGIKDLRAASALMHGEMIPAADALDKANFDHLNDAYTAARASAAGRQIALYFFGALVLAVLLAAQVYLARRTHRLVSLPLALATVVLVGYVLWLSGALAYENEQLRATKADCFDSIHALWKAKSVAYDANGDESLYLLGLPPSEEAVYDQSFHAKAAQLAGVPVTPALVASCEAGTVPTFPGDLGVELRNITFVGEHTAAVDTLRNWGAYMALDAQIRTLETTGHHAEAVALCTGTAPGQSDYAFGQFDDALDRTLGINQDHFDGTVARAFSGLRPLPIASALAALLIVLLTWLGIAPRLREYQG